MTTRLNDDRTVQAIVPESTKIMALNAYRDVDRVLSNDRQTICHP